MKTIGRTNENNYLMEVTADEYWALDKLAKALEGESLEDITPYRREPSVNGDFAGTFGAILAFTLARFRINEMFNMLNDFQNTLMNGNADIVKEIDKVSGDV